MRIHKDYLQPKKCKVTGKTKFRDSKMAGRAMMRIWSHDPQADIQDLHTYICPSCGGWHIGHRSYYEKATQNPDTNRDLGTETAR